MKAASASLARTASARTINWHAAARLQLKRLLDDPSAAQTGSFIAWARSGRIVVRPTRSIGSGAGKAPRARRTQHQRTASQTPLALALTPGRRNRLLCAAREEDPYDAYGLPKIVKVRPAATRRGSKLFARTRPASAEETGQAHPAGRAGASQDIPRFQDRRGPTEECRCEGCTGPRQGFSIT